MNSALQRIPIVLKTKLIHFYDCDALTGIKGYWSKVGTNLHAVKSYILNIFGIAYILDSLGAKMITLYP